jgi:hypothetical protein
MRVVSPRHVELFVNHTLQVFRNIGLLETSHGYRCIITAYGILLQAQDSDSEVGADDLA